ncbi:unannotated protein [freshwater metagenome]|jgi:hypothetical protein|uniref:Unannotated protein n=1 Tax=freshwater metagenome TaxID=449393 RepID=A0A6J6H3V3_9ZZZZ|nr:hypothetical protein [Actinomycetota bacterium]MSZ23974.1 hypothetical protein [Actinomycetota bacterium]MSZ93396.1 hypothetical protein [Actinomycetota bacterium]
MGDIWSGNVDSASKLPLLLCMLTFIATFVITRVIVRMIRSGRGPFKDNSVGGVHIHHVVPGIILMIVGGLLAIGGVGTGWDNAAGVIFGMGLALVLDEFALILHLQDVYWEEEGRLSVDAVFVLAGVMMLLLVAGSPFGVDVDRGQSWLRIGLVVLIAIDLTMAAICAAKGKLGTAVAGIAVPVIAYVGAVRIARPSSPWAKRAYGKHPNRMEKSKKREEEFDSRWRTKVSKFQDFVAGTFIGEGS